MDTKKAVTAITEMYDAENDQSTPRVSFTDYLLLYCIKELIAQIESLQRRVNELEVATIDSSRDPSNSHNAG